MMDIRPRTLRNPPSGRTSSTVSEGLRQKALWAALSLALGLPYAHAQTAPPPVRPNGSTSTSAIQAPNGVPLVNIAAPNAAGLSHNRYQQFDVASQGLILNNSGAISSTQLAGYVAGNPNLSNGSSARLILNEITSTAPSKLGGAIEVAGHAADVVVANPNGIDCTGCSFINTPHVTLATGTPLLDASGALSGYRVTGGQLTVDGAGLGASEVDRVDLIARAVSVNAGVWARQLNMVAGANRVDAASLATQAIAPTDAQPAVALDVSAIGGMYAGVIRLVGTEAGLGINSEGRIAAQDGNLTLTSAGDMALSGKTSATGSLSLHGAQAVSNAGTLAAGGTVSVVAADIANAGTLYSGGPMTLSASGQLSNSGKIQAQGGGLALHASGALSNASGGSILANGAVNLSAASLNNAGALESAQSVGVQVSGRATNLGSLHADRGDLSFAADTLDSRGDLGAGGGIALAGRTSLSSTGTLVAGTAVSLSAPRLITAGTVQAGTALAIDGGSLDNSGALYALGGNWRVRLAGAFTNTATGDLYAGGDLALDAASLTNAGVVEAKHGVRLVGAGDLTNNGTLQADGGDLALVSGGQLTQIGHASAVHDISFSAVKALVVRGQAVANGDVNLSGASLDTAGIVQAGGQLSLISVGTLINAGKLYALGGGWTAAVGGAFDNQASGDIYGSDGIALKAASLINAGAVEAKQDTALVVSGALANSGHVQADQGSIALAAGSLDSSGMLSAQRNVQAQVTGVVRNSGTLVSGQAITLSAGSFENNASGQVQSGADLALSALTIDNAGNLHARGNAVIGGGDLGNAAAGMLLADGALTVNNAGEVSNAGLLQAGSNFTLDHATSLVNAAGATVYAGHDLDLDLAHALANDGLAYGAHAVAIAAGSADNAGILRSGGSLSLDSTADAGSSGAIQAQQDLHLVSGGIFANAGKLYAVDGRLDVQSVGAFTSSAQGDIYGSQDVTIAADSLANVGLLEAGRGMSLDVRGDASNSGTIQADQGGLTMSGATLANQGALSATGNMRLTGSTWLSNLGQAVSGQALTMASIDLRNNGQTQSGTATTLQAVALDNSGRIQAGTTLAVSGNRNLTNEAAGQLLAAGDISADTAMLLSNAGVIQAGGNLDVDAAGAIANRAGGMLYGSQRTSLQLGGKLDNAGRIYGTQNLSLTSTDFINGGSLRSDAVLQVAVQGNASSSGAAYAGGNAVWNVSGALANAGTLAAAGDTTVTAGSLTGTGTLAAGLQGDGSLGTTGALRVGTDGVLVSNGRTLAGGDLVLRGSAIDLSGSRTRAGGDATLTATQGNVSNQGGDLTVNGTLTLATPDALLNGGANAAQGGKIAAQALALQAASLDNRYGTLTQNGNGDLALSFAGTLDNAHGTLAGNAGNLTISAASLDNSGGAIQHAGSGILSLSTNGDLTNNGGQVAGNGALAIQSGGVLRNVGGSFGVAGDATVHAASMDNSHGTFAAAHAGLSLNQALSNVGGTVQASSGMTVSAGTLDNTGGYLKGTGSQALSVATAGALTNAAAGGTGGFLGGNGVVAVHAGSLRNAGQIYAGSVLTVASQGTLVNDGGALQAMSTLDVSAVSSLSNRNGRIEAGAGDSGSTLAVNAGSIDNTGGRVANAGRGVSTIGAGGSIVNRGGTLGGQGNATLNATGLDNSQSGHVVAGQSLTLGLGGMNNAAGTLYAAANLAWSNANAHLGNAGGSLGAGGNLGLGLLSVDNSAGDIAAGGNVNLTLAAFTGAGRAVAGQDLTLALSGGYANGSGNTLKANRDLTLNLGGNLTNPTGATLTAVRNLSVTASNIDNAAGAGINSAGTTLTARSGLINAGRIEGDTITLKAASLINTGTVIGSSIGVTAGNLTNGSDLGAATDNAPYQNALIAATSGIDLFVSGTLLNRDATIFTLGDLRIGANAGGGRSGAVVNRSGDIEADGNVTLAATKFTNERRVFQTSIYNLDATEQAQNTLNEAPLARYRYDDTDPTHKPPYVDASQVVGAPEIAVADAYCSSRDNDHYRCIGYPYGQGSATTFQMLLTDTVVSMERLVKTSAQSRLLAGGDISLNGSVRNDKSMLAAGHNLVINGRAQSGEVSSGTIGGETVENIAWAPTASVQRSAELQVRFEGESHDDALCAPINGGSRCWVPSSYETYGPQGTGPDLSALLTLSLASGQAPSWITLPGGESAPAYITAGNTVAITAHTIDNTVVGADGQPVHAVIGLGQNGGSQAVNGSNAGPVGNVGGSTAGVGDVVIDGAPVAVGGTVLGLPAGRAGGAGGQAPVAGGAGSLVAAGTPGAPPIIHAPPSQVVSALSGGHATVALPQSGLYTVRTNPSSPYLVETDPRFTQYSQFISSDYMMDQLAIDPSDMRKRLGDGFYEQRTVLDQIASLTGRRFLDDNTDALAQYRTLMDAGVRVARQFDLSVGIALTPEQMANLTQDMVWLASATVDGQQVLVPVVYLSAAHAKALAAGGATIAGKNVILTASGDITNNGTIAASDSAQLTAANLLNSGTLSAGHNLSINAAQNILNGGTIGAGGNVSLVAGNDVSIGVEAAAALGAVDLTGLSGPMSAVALGNLQPGSIGSGGNLAISAGRDLNLDIAPVTAGSNLSLAAGRDLTVTATAISAGKDAQLLAGRDLSLAAIGHTVHTEGPHYDHTDTTTNWVSSVTAGGNLSVVAGHDLASEGAQLGAGNILAVGAGRDLTLDTVTDVASGLTHAAEGRTAVSESHRDETLQGSTLSGANGVVVSADRDLAATAATIGSVRGAVVLGAGHDLTLAAEQENHTASKDTTHTRSGLLSSSTTTTRDASSDSYAVGTALSGSNVTLSAGHDLTTQGTQVSATQDIGLSAGHDVLLGAAQDTHSEEHDRTTTKRGGLGVLVGTSKGDLFTRTHKVQQDSSSDAVAVGSVLSGDQITVAAGHDLTTQAAQVAGTHDVVLAAAHDLTVGTADNLHSEEHDLKVNTYGAQRSGLHGMFGVAKAKQTASETDTTPTGSLIGSTDGAVTLNAGQDVHITGSDVLSQTGTAIVGQNVSIDAAVGTADSHQTQSLHTGGIMAGLTGGAATHAEQAWASGQRAGQVSDKRLKALYAAQAAYGAHDAYQGASAGAGSAGSGGGAQGAANASGVSLRVGIGASSASTHSDTHDDISYASHIRSSGDVTIAATNGDLNVIGSQVGGHNVALAASHDLNLRSQAEQHIQSDHSANARGELGISIGSQTGFYVTADGGKGVAHGNGTTYANSSVTASHTLSLFAGNDATIRGAQAKGDTVLAGIGGNLTLESQQTTDDYASHSWQAGGTYVYGSGSEVHASAGMVDSSYRSVQQTSGIDAGSGGFQLQVGGNTDLKGAVITSIANPALNLLDTGTLSFSDLENQASYNAMSAGISVGSSNAGTSASPSIGIPQFGDKSSTTQAGIAQGTIDVRGGPADLAGLDRNPNIDAGGLKTIFNQQKVAEQQELGNVAGQVGMRAAGDIASYMANHVTTEQEQKAWSDGGANKTLLHGLVGAATAALGGGNALQGALGAAASEKASGAMQDYLVQHGVLPTDPLFKTMMQLGGTAIGGVIGGGSGAATALQGDQFNRQLHPSEQQLAQSLAAKSNGLYTTKQIEDAMRLSGYSLGPESVMPAETSQTGVLVNVNNSGSIYDMSAGWSLVSGLNDSQYLMQQVPSQVSPDLAAYVIANTGGTASPYAWAPEQQGLPPANSTLQAIASYNVGTRALGGLQMVGGGLELASGVAAATTCETGFGCAAAMYLGGAGLDNAMAGASMLGTGRPTATLGQQMFEVLGMSPNAAALTYGATQLVPVGMEAYAANVTSTVAGSAAIRSQVLGNIADSQAALVSSNFGRFSQAEGQLQESLGIWPPNGGAYAPIYDTTLEVGTQLDRYGYPGGNYLSPLGNSFRGRALPSSYEATKPYFQYEVAKPIPGVTQSNALPWFGQRGMEAQFQVQNSVQWYLDNGYLKVIKK
jgi:filamentous hemagglutinin